MYGCRKQKDKVGILLAQLGTPEAPTKAALKTYLKEFLSDPRVIEANRFIWWLTLNGIVLRTRPAKSAELYKRVWTKEGSPLLLTTQAQTNKLRERFKKHTNVSVEFGMRYGTPSLDSAVKKLIQDGCGKIVLIPLYPQYASASTGSTYDAVFTSLLKEREVPTLRCVDPFFDNEIYISGLSKSIENYIATSPNKPERIIFSYHGIPRRYVKAGDPYCCHCTATTKLVSDKLKLDPSIVLQSYQSRFGKEPWLTPYLDELVKTLAAQGTKRLAVISPGFVTDCLETIDEIGYELKKQFLEEGGVSLDLIPCLNDSDVFIDCLEDLVRRTASDWLDKKEIHSTLNCPAKIEIKTEQQMGNSCSNPVNEERIANG